MMGPWKANTSHLMPKDNRPMLTGECAMRIHCIVTCKSVRLLWKIVWHTAIRR